MNRHLLYVRAPDASGMAELEAQYDGWLVSTVDTARAADAMLERGDVDASIVVFDRPGHWAADMLDALRRHPPPVRIAATARLMFADAPLMACIEREFHHCLTLPVDRRRLAALLADAGMARCPPGSDEPLAGMVGRSPVMRALHRQLVKVAYFDAPVLLSGESGTGKEVTARAIHRLSRRAAGPMVVVDCGALPANLVQSELFGHEKGAFTGAHQRKIGSIQAADGGVVLLDEIGDLPLELQSSLLRFLQEKTIVRVGATQPIRVDVRVIAASHIDLADAVRRGRFREDLYYRLNVLHLHLPPLRARREDIPLLAQSWFDQPHAQKSPQVKGLSAAALEAMAAYAWPGNVRELLNRVQKAMIMCDGPLITPADLGLAGDASTAAPISIRPLRKVRGETDCEAIHQALHLNRSNVAAAARQLGVSRTTFYRLVQKFGIDIRGRAVERGPDGLRSRFPS